MEDASTVTEEIARIIDQRKLHILFQPIAILSSCEVLGCEALVRGPSGSALETPAALFAAAAPSGLEVELDKACVAAALRSFAALKHPGRLFLNILPRTLFEFPGYPGWIEDQLIRAQLDPRTIVLELTEHGAAHPECELAAAVAPLRSLGIAIAIDDFGSGNSGLKAWSVIRPDFVKVDRFFINGIEKDPVNAEILRAAVEMGWATGSQIIAEGIENYAQCALVRELGVDFVQGYWLGRPQAVPRPELTQVELMKPLRHESGADCAEHLARPIPPVPSCTPVAEVLARFQHEPQWTALAVVSAHQPIGLIRRDDLLVLYSRPLHPEIYNRKTAVSVMDAQAVQIDARARLEQVSRLVTAQGDFRRRQDFIITRNGGYLGLGHAMDVLREMTAQQMQIARHSNPLTGLPGNREIDAHLRQLLQRRQPFIACHLDLDHFKAFNDAYGYSRGDQVLLHVAQAIKAHIRARIDFLGHVGGDDFVFFLRSPDGCLRLTTLVNELSASLLNFHSSEHRAAGGYAGQNREGGRTRFGLLSVSVGAVEMVDSRGLNTERILDELRHVKALAKAAAGNSCLLSSGMRVIDLMNQPDLPELPSTDTVVLQLRAS